MKPIELDGPRFVVVAIALAVAVAAYAHAQGSSVGQTTSLGGGSAAESRSNEANAVEAKVASTGLTGRLEAALGNAFGGVWFESATGQVHVGVTSPASRRNAEAVAAEADLTENVIETSVHSTWAQLEAAQERWNRQLIDLFERGTVATSLLADRNALEVELVSAVPPARRAALEREAAADSVNVQVIVAPYRRLRVRSLVKQCNKFEKGLAFCDPTLVSGVTVDGTVVGGLRETCTGGPTAILKSPSNLTNATKTYIVTAGHCIEKGGGPGKKWYSYNKEGEGKGEKEIGLSGSYIFGGVDVGLINITTSYWAKANDPVPVVPKVASWDKDAESEPVPVITQNPPAMNAKTCMSGQMVGTTCGGKIIKTDRTLEIDGKAIVDNLIEVEGITVDDGDSGGPFFAEQQFKANPSTGYMEGTLVGENSETKKPVFQSLESSFAELKKVRKIDLELLRQANEKRHKQKMKAGKYPATIHGQTTGTQEFTTEAGVVKCKLSLFHAVVSEESPGIAVAPEYKECVGPLEVSATVDTEECTFNFYTAEKVSTDNYRAPVEVACPVGQSIKLSVFTCKAEVKAQEDLATTDIIDDTGASPKKDITVRPTVEGIAYTVTQDGFLCPFAGTGERTDGKYTSTENITATGQSPSEPAEKIDIEVTGE